MSHIFQCGDHTALVSFLYDECEPAERIAIDAHMTLCAACAAELAALVSARLQLASWTPPEADLGFQIVRPQVSGPRLQTAEAVGLGPEAYRRAVPWFSRPLPAWAQAVAACLIFAAGLTLGVVRGSMPTASPALATTGPAPAAPSIAPSSTELAALEGRMRAEMAQLRTASVIPGAAAPQGTSEAQLMARVRTLIEESEQRQQRELALRLSQVSREVDTQHKADLLQIQQDFGQQQDATMEYLVKTSGGVK